VLVKVPWPWPWLDSSFVVLGRRGEESLVLDCFARPEDVDGDGVSWCC